MRLTQRVASAAVMAVIGSFAGTAAWADQSFTGIVTILDRTTSEVVIKQAPSGETVGANTPGVVEKFKLRTVPESLHAGEKVTVTYTESGGVKTIGNVTEQKD
jgi:hypothetical protein